MGQEASISARTLYFKDERLDRLADLGNVAQFVSFGCDLKQRFSRIRGFAPNYRFPALLDAIRTLLERSPEATVNIRSFKPDEPQGHEFIYGIPSAETVEREVRRLAAAGLFVIVNETVGVNDGGVSGVLHGNVMEFAPGATPRVVETGKIVSVSRGVGERLLRSVYGFVPSLPEGPGLRIEFSIHPIRRGFSSDYTIIWELQEIPSGSLSPVLVWPNAFSEFLGDKAFGLLIADAIGLHVPFTTAICRNVAPFTFGTPTRADVKWIRTAPATPEPGLFPTIRGWTDPFALMNDTDGGQRISSVLIQDEVSASFSGAMLTGRDGNAIIEGVEGFGDDFMLGRTGPVELDEDLRRQLLGLHSSLYQHVGSVRVEWSFDGRRIWMMQLQQESAVSSGRVIVPGDVDSEFEFDVSQGLSGLREMIEMNKGRRIGIKLIGNVGMTSHIADVLRRCNIPSRIVLHNDH